MRYTFSLASGAAEPVTQAEVVERLHLLTPSENEYTYTIDPLITAAREYCEARTGYAFIQQTVTAYPTLDDLAQDYFYLPRCPVSAITSVLVYDDDGNSTEVTGYQYDTEGAFRIGDAIDLSSARELNPVAITYTAGEATCPDSAKQAMLLLIGHWYQNRESVQTGAVTAVEIAQTTDALLRLYKRWW